MTLVLITGATSGIGAALARQLAQKGYRLILTGRDGEKLRFLAKELKVEDFIACDLKIAEDRKKLVDMIRHQLPDIVINNAGYGIYGDALNIPIEEQLGILKVNAEAALELTLEAARSLVKSKKTGTILNVSSISGEFPCPGMSVYAASKAFLTHVSEALHTELSGHGISVLVSCPGMVNSNFATRAANHELPASEKKHMLTTQYAAEQIVQQIENKEQKRIFNWRYRLVCFFAKYFVPITWIKNIIWKAIQKRI